MRYNALLCLLLAAPAWGGDFYAVPEELWDRPRSGSAMLAQPVLRQAVSAFLAQPGAHLIVHHAPDQEALLQAEELRAWLAALALEPERMILMNDLPAKEPLKIEIRK